MARLRAVQAGVQQGRAEGKDVATLQRTIDMRAFATTFAGDDPINAIISISISSGLVRSKPFGNPDLGSA